MTIYYNPTYSATPYRKNENNVDVGNIYCGNTQLLQRLLFYASDPFLPVSNEERVAYYHACMQGKVDASSPFYESFRTDSADDAVGWNYVTKKGNDAKVALFSV